MIGNILPAFIKGKRIILNAAEQPTTPSIPTVQPTPGNAADTFISVARPEENASSKALHLQFVGTPNNDILLIRRVNKTSGTAINASAVNLGNHHWGEVNIPLFVEQSASSTKLVAPDTFRILDPVDALKKLTPAQLEELPAEGLLKLTADQWAQIPKETLAQLSPYQLRFLNNDTAAQMSCEQLNVLQLDESTHLTPYSRGQMMLNKAGLKPQPLGTPLQTSGPLYEQAAKLKGKIQTTYSGAIKAFYVQDVRGVRPASEWRDTTRKVLDHEVPTREEVLLPGKYEIATTGLDAISKGTIRSGAHEGKTAYYSLNAGRNQSYIVDVRKDQLDTDYIRPSELDKKHVFCTEVDHGPDGIISGFYDKDGNYLGRESFDPHQLVRLEWDEHRARLKALEAGQNTSTVENPFLTSA